MLQALNSLIAVVGTLLGASLTYWFQRRAADRSERRTVLSAFAAAVMEQRRGEYDRWWRCSEDPAGAAYLEARTESYRLRSAARQQFYRIRLLTGDAELLRLAERAITVTAQIHKARERAAFEANGAAAEQALEAFLAYAARRR
ncbi:hypothetical protein [Streptomyces tailanensis]|uniref:hypothetical protein n=1 Tax=Streptomyces tailanensis TaxID=2569858 RepID=UPI001FEACA75|nr:hypothetical protein [Streptomyces tailanensis]